MLVDDTVAGADETAAGAALRQARFGHLAFDVDRVAGQHRAFDVQLHVQEGEAGVLHRRLRQQPLGKGVDQRAGRRAALDVALLAQKFEVGEQHLDHAGAVDEIGDVGLGHGAADGLEGPPDRQILEIEAEPHGFHMLLPDCAVRRYRPEPLPATIVGR